MFGVKTFDAIQARLDQDRNHIVGAVQSRMRHDGEAAGLMDEFDGFECGHFGLGHPCGSVLFQETFKSLIQISDQAGLHQSPGDVWTSGRLAIGQRENRFNLERHV